MLKMRLTIKQMILNALELNKQDKKLIGEVNKVCGYANLENFKRILKDEDKKIENLDGFLNVVELLFPNDFNELLVAFLDQVNPETITAKLLLEYLTLHHMYDLKEKLIREMKQSDKRDVKEFVTVYEIQHKFEKKQISFVNAIEELNGFSKARIETKAFARISQLYCYYDVRDIRSLNYILDELENDINQIKNDFLRNCYNGRLFRIKLDVSFHTGNIDDVLESSFHLENALAPTKSASYLQIGNSYMMKSYDKAMFYFNKAMEYKNFKSENQIKQSIAFTSLLWNKLENYIVDGTDSNELFYYVRSGNKSMALRMLDKIDFDSLNNHQKGFNCFYKGLLFGDKTYFYKSIEYFNYAGEKFYKKLPIIELKKMGEHEAILSALSA